MEGSGNHGRATKAADVTDGGSAARMVALLIPLSDAATSKQPKRRLSWHALVFLLHRDSWQIQPRNL